jgi:hypothetical protein
MGVVISERSMESRKRCGGAVGEVWNAIATATEKHGELTGAEWIWVINQILGRFVSIHLNEERTGELDAAVD